MDAARKALHARKARWRSHQGGGAAAAGGPALRVGIAASITAEPIVPLLGAELLERGFAADVVLAAYDQIFQVCLDWRRAFDAAAGEPDALLLLWRLDELAADAVRAAAGGDAGAQGLVLARVDDLADALATLRASFPGTLVAGTPPFPALADLDARDPTSGPRLAQLHAAASARWRERLAGLAGVAVLDVDAAERRFGSAAAADVRTAYLYRQPWRESFWLALACDLARVLAAARTASRKCLVLDCDGTLWGGVLGEVGLRGIALGDEFPGSAFRDFQRQLVALHARGVLLALASKNDEAAVLEVFERHDAMCLRREHLAAWRIDWSPKADNVAALAAELNLGLDALVFVDDHPAEIAEVGARCPGVVCLAVPEEIARLPLLLPDAALFDRLAVTEEDRQRTGMFQAETQRRAAGRALGREEFLASLGLEIEVFEAGPEHLARVAQLVAKTNQFNLTTIRYTPEEIEALSKSAEALLLAARVRDRFGDSGLVGVALLRRGRAAWDLDSFLLSCRVLGRGLETAFLARIGERLRALGARSLRARYVPSAKNAAVAELLPSHGFVRDGEDFCIELAQLPGAPAHVRAC